MSSDNVPIPKFDGSTKYDTWRYQFMLLLEYKNCKSVIDSETRPNAIKEEEWKRMDVKAKFFISLAVNPDEIIDCESAYAMIKKLDSLYKTKSESRIILIERRLDALKFKEGEDVTEFFTKFERIVNELSSAGVTIDPKKKLHYLLLALPKTCHHLIDTVDLVPEKDRNINYIREKLLTREAAAKKGTDSNVGKSDGSNEASSFKVSVNKDVICYKCQKPGHISRHCNQRSNDGTYRGRGQNFENRGRNFSHGRGNNSSSFRGQHSQNFRGTARGQSFRGRWNSNNNSQNYQQRSNYGNSYDHHDISSLTVQVEVNCTATDGKVSSDIVWTIDSGCTDHITNIDKYFCQYIVLKKPVTVKVGNNKFEKATKVGNILCNFNGTKVMIRNVYFCSEMCKNLISVSTLTKLGNVAIFYDECAEIFNSNNKLLFTAFNKNGLYEVPCNVIDNFVGNISVNLCNKVKTNKEKWHRILGHVNFKDLKTMSKFNIVSDLPEIDNNFMTCEFCLSCKLTNLSFENNRKRARYVGQIIHTDVKYMDVPSYKGDKYFVSFIDDYSRVAQIYIIKQKSEVFNCFKSFFNYIANFTKNPVLELRCDNGLEYLNQDFYTFAREKGFCINSGVPYVHELNGVAERYNRTIMDRARCLRKEANLDKKWWPEIVMTACYIGNRLLNSSTFERLTPYEIFTGDKPSVSNLRHYGSVAYCRVPDEKRQTQDDKGVRGILVGYTGQGYRILVNGKVVVARHVRFIDMESDFIGFSDESDVEEGRNEEEEDFEDFAEERDSQGERGSSEERDGQGERRKSKRVSKKPSRYDDYVMFAGFCSIDPKSYEEVLESPNKKKWLSAMRAEMKALTDSKTWSLVDRPIDKKVLTSKWIFKLKPNGLFKARLVVRGFEQENCFDDIYSPVARLSTLRTLLSVAVVNKCFIHHMDVKSAFLNSDIRSEVYLEPPDGVAVSQDKVYLLHKSLYGLKESPRNWYDLFNDFMVSLNFIRGKSDGCLYSRMDGVMCILFVDDLLICSPNQKSLNSVKSSLKLKFKMTDLGAVETYLGIDFSYENGIMRLSQSRYIEKLAREFDVVDSNVKFTPMEENLRLESSETFESTEYRSLIGGLLYIASCTRPDVAYSVNYLSRFLSCPTSETFKYAQRILIYLYHSRHLSLTLKSNCLEKIAAYVDSDWAADLVDSKSTTGFVVYVFGNPVVWKSCKQKIVSKSSTFAEYYALSDCVDEVLYVKQILIDLGTAVSELNNIRIFEDNNGALSIAKFGNFTKKSRHIRVSVHFVTDLYKKNVIDIVKIDTCINVADIFTKSLGKNKFTKHRENLNLC
ncbi:hypothetical protein V9T40_013666 [Parthenolecanium corni]|uniref:Retrovirus-related Pol polyprotein from transposon TNT 1-94 n=1 Tax=Parthenolecanium corni TaxID=536013 RepID=A0AAN9Y2U1_9HEMI